MACEDERLDWLHTVGLEAAEIVRGYAVAATASMANKHFNDTSAIHTSLAEEVVTLRKWTSRQSGLGQEDPFSKTHPSFESKHGRGVDGWWSLWGEELGWIGALYMHVGGWIWAELEGDALCVDVVSVVCEGCECVLSSSGSYAPGSNRMRAQQGCRVELAVSTEAVAEGQA